MTVRIDEHAAERARQRGAGEAEIRDVVDTGAVIPAKLARLGKAKVYDFRRRRLGKYYEQKKIEVYYVVEGNDAVIITVYVFYGKWE